MFMLCKVQMDCCSPVNLRENTRVFTVTACETYFRLAWGFDGTLSRRAHSFTYASTVSYVNYACATVLCVL